MKTYLLLLSILLAACWDGEDLPDFDVEEAEGMRPLYANPDELSIGLESPRDITKAGKIYSYDNLLLVNEVGLGFHIFDNTDPANPVNLRFVSVPGNHDMAVKDGIVYADNFGDLLALEISPDTVKVLKRITGLIGSSDEFPPQRGYFECVDESKGVLIGWERVTLYKPQCYKP